MEIITNAWEIDTMFSRYKDDKDLLVHATKHISGWNCIISLTHPLWGVSYTWS